MAQYDFGTIDPNTKSGTALASDLNSYRNAVNSMHSGSSAPSYITAGMMWVDTTSADYEVKLYDGAQSITVAIIDATNNVARVAVDPAETSYITSTTSAQIRHVIASTNIFTTRSTGIQFNLASPTITDNNSNEWLSFTTTASAVNHIDIANSATGGAVALSAAGTDTNISIALTPKGTGVIEVSGQASFSDGTAAAPSITNTGDLNTGIFFPAADTIAFAEGGSEVARFDSSGNLMVNTTTSALVSGNDSKLALVYPGGNNQFGFTLRPNADNTSAVTFCRADGLALVGSITQTASATAFNTSSDYRLKENVQPMQDALAKIVRLNPVTYNWKIDGSEGQGFIAHELQAVVPDCVTGDKDAVDAEGNPQYQGVDTSFLVATLVKAVQEQQAVITALETRLAALETSP
jgi:hypothetical protein